MMKKFMFFALASAAMLASCSSDDVVAVDEANVAQIQDGPAAIQIGLGGAAFTRGTGTVGSTSTSTNKWAGQLFNLYMLKKGTMDLATKNNMNTETAADAIYDNTVFHAPDNGSNYGLAIDTTGAVKYYPATGEYDFWAYRLDNAEKATPSLSATDITVPFTIDGSQDILVAKAIPTASDSTKLNLKDADAKNHVPFYSARAARKDVQPQMTFKHLLSRLTFRVAPGDSTTAGDFPVIIKGVEVKSAVNGTLTIASKTADQDIAWGTANTDSAFVKVKQRAINATGDTLFNANLEDLDEVSLKGKWGATQTVYDFTPAHSVTIGEALLVAPSTQYELVVKGHQNVDTNGDGVGDDDREFDLSLNLTHAGGFVAGTSYNVQIVVYGLQEIKVYVTLNPWEEETLDPIGQD